MGKNKPLSAEQQAEKKKSLLITIAVILAAVLVLGLVAYARLSDSGVILRSKTAAESENYKVSGTMMAYFFNNNYQSYAQTLQYLGVDTSKPLKSQSCPYLSEEGTWFDYFVAMTKDYTKNILALCEGANKAGITLDDADKADIDSSLGQLKSAASSSGYAVNQYLAALTGVGVNIKDVEKCMELTALASKYRTAYVEGLSYTDDEISAYADANPDKINGVDYYAYTIKTTDIAEKDADGNPVGDATENASLLYAEAEKLAAAKTSDEFISLIRAYMADKKSMEEADIDSEVESAFTRHALKSNLAAVADWAFEAKAGDTYISGNNGDSTLAVYFLAKEAYRDETPTRNVRHILFSSDTYKDDTEVKAAYAEWESAGFTEEKFLELEKKYNEDTGSSENGGLYENVTVGSTVNEFNAWLFDDARKAGDHDIVESSYGWHIMYYVGEGDSVTWKSTAKDDMMDDDYNEMIKEYSAGITYNDKAIEGISA